MIYRIDRFVFDADSFELKTKYGEVIPLQRRALELLLLLVRNASLIVSKDMINAEVWGGLHLSRNAIYFQIGALREALGDTKRPYRFIETVHSKGLRFAGDVIAERSVRPVAEPATLSEDALPTDVANDLVGEQPTIAVLQFDQPDADDRLDGLASALPTDIMLALSRLRMLRVTARSSSFLIAKEAASPLLLKSALGADYGVH